MLLQVGRSLLQLLEHIRIDALLAVILGIAVAQGCFSVRHVAEDIGGLCRATGREDAGYLIDVVVVLVVLHDLLYGTHLLEHMNVIRVPETVRHPSAVVRIAVRGEVRGCVGKVLRIQVGMQVVSDLILPRVDVRAPLLHIGKNIAGVAVRDTSGVGVHVVEVVGTPCSHHSEQACNAYMIKFDFHILCAI